MGVWILVRGSASRMIKQTVSSLRTSDLTRIIRCYAATFLQSSPIDTHNCVITPAYSMQVIEGPGLAPGTLCSEWIWAQNLSYVLYLVHHNVHCTVPLVWARKKSCCALHCRGADPAHCTVHCTYIHGTVESLHLARGGITKI